MATPPPAARLAQLAQLSSKIFDTVYNPTAARTGNKILRQRLLGPSLTQYHPTPLVHFRDIKALYPELGLVDVDEQARLDEIARRKRRGKGAPKKGNQRSSPPLINLIILTFTLLAQVKANVLPTRRNRPSTVLFRTFVQLLPNKQLSLDDMHPLTLTSPVP